MVWNLYGKQYELTSFLDSHPGGKTILVATENEKDLTALFETYHAFSDKVKIRKMLDKYEIKDANANADADAKEIVKKYDFTNYNLLLDMVKKEFPTRVSIKAPFSWGLQNIFLFFLYCYSFYTAMFSWSTPIFYRCILAFFSGGLLFSVYFNILHDGSHYGISVHPFVNEFLSKISNSWGLWNSNIWFYHHVVNHHSFTGEKKKDPDLYHLKPFLNKVANDRKLLLSNNVNWVFGFLTFFPGQFLGQGIFYIVSVLKNPIRIFGGIKMPNRNMYDLFDIVFMGLCIYCLYSGLYLPTIFYIISLNFWYAINIIGDHDTYETAVENHYEGDDWLKLQICNSGNFLNGNILWTRLFGAINYQIEHHLFPNMSNVHYPTIAPIVKKFCKEKNIPYVNHTTLWGMYMSYLKMLKRVNS